MTVCDFDSNLQGSRLGGAGFAGHCPAHDDQRVSLGFQDGECGILVKCHAGFSLNAVTTALGLRITDLFMDGGETSAHLPGGS